jgi:hypothetical protein
MMSYRRSLQCTLRTYVVEHLTPVGDATIYPTFCIVTDFLHKQRDAPSVVKASRLTFSARSVFVRGQEVMTGRRCWLVSRVRLLLTCERTALINMSTEFYISKLTAWSRVLLKKLVVSQLVKIFLSYYDIQRFITVFIRARHLSLS